MPKLSDLLSDGTKKELLEHKKELKNTFYPIKNRHPENKKLSQGTKSQHYFFTVVPEFVALDVETTGLDFKKDRIIEIGLVKFKNGKIIDELSTFINPDINVPEIITELTGINDRDLYNAPKFSEIADKILNFIDNLPVCGHQIEFDISFLKEELKRISKEAIGNDLIDTALLARIILFNNERFSLKKVCDVLNVKLDYAHRALNDAKACGEIAIRLLPEIANLPLSVRQNIALYAPASFLKNLVFKTLKGSRPYISLETRKEEILPLSFLNDLSDKRIDTDLLLGLLLKVKAELSHFSEISDNFIAFYKKISCEIINTINSKSIYVTEVSTGYERLLTYIIPLAYYAVTKNKKVIISIRDKRSKEIICKKILPFLSKETGKSIRYTELKRKENYLCLYRFEELLRGKFGNLSPRERFAILPLIAWSNSSFTGDIEEQHSFNPKWFLKIWNLISAQSCNCTKGCPYFNICFWEKAQKKASNSHIVIVNDSLLFSEHQFLEKNSEEIILIDDAHLLNYNCSRARSFEIDTNRLNLFLDLVNSLYQLLEESTDKKEIVEIAKKFNKILKHLRKESTVFLSKLTSIATSKYPNNSEYEFTYNQDFFVNVGEVDSLIYSLDELIDILIILKQVLSFSDVKKCNFLSSIVQSTRETSSQIKAELAYLTCADIENHIFVISGNRDKGWVKLKGTPINNSNFMAEIWNNHKGTLIFTSQSISIDNTFEYFNEKNGLDRCKKDIKYNILKTSDIANDNNIVIGCLNCSLSENSKDSISKVEEFVTLFHNSLEKNLLIISAKDEKLLGLYNQLRNNPKIDRNKIFLNAITLNKHNELEGMVKDSKNILLSSEIFLNQLELNEYGFEIILILDIPITPFLEEENRYLKRKDAQLPYPIAEKILKLKLYKGFMLNYGIKRGILVLINNPFTENKFVEILKKSMEIEFNIFNTINELIETGKKYYL